MSNVEAVWLLKVKEVNSHREVDGSEDVAARYTLKSHGDFVERIPPVFIKKLIDAVPIKRNHLQGISVSKEIRGYRLVDFGNEIDCG